MDPAAGYERMSLDDDDQEEAPAGETGVDATPADAEGESPQAAETEAIAAESAPEAGAEATEEPLGENGQAGAAEAAQTVDAEEESSILRRSE